MKRAATSRPNGNGRPAGNVRSNGNGRSNGVGRDGGIELTTAPGHLIRRAQQAHNLIWSTEVDDSLTSIQFAVLNVLVAEPGIDQKTLGERVHLDRSTIADVVARLVKRGLIKRVRDTTDGRRRLLKLSSAGTATLRKATPAVERVGVRLVEPLSAAEVDQFMTLLEKVVRGNEVTTRDVVAHGG